MDNCKLPIEVQASPFGSVVTGSINSRMKEEGEGMNGSSFILHTSALVDDFPRRCHAGDFLQLAIVSLQLSIVNSLFRVRRYKPICW